ncbi:MAG TPA: hypothetical protein VFZ18_10245 [Longimicrobiaceae bacterium]
MRRTRFFVILALAGCASGAATGRPPENPARVTTAGTGADILIANDTEAGALGVRATPEAAWIGLPGVFEALEIPVDRVDSRQKTLGNSGFTTRRRLGGQPLSAYLSCGSTLSGPIANQYEVRLAVVSQILPAAEGDAHIRTRVEATARSRDGASSSSVPCASTGGLETRIAELLNRSVGR